MQSSQQAQQRTIAAVINALRAAPPQAQMGGWCHRVPARFARTVFVLVGAILVLALLPLCGGARLHAQRIAGTVVDAQSEQPVADARVILLDADSDQVAQSSTSNEGRFELTAPRAGTYTIQVSRLGYAALTTGTLKVEFNELVTVTLRVGVAPVELPRLSVVNRDRDVLNDLSYDALYARRGLDRQVGSNRIFVKADPEFRSAIRVSDILWFVTPRKQEYSNGDRTWSTCLPIVIRHGFLIQYREQVESILDGSAQDLEGLESYRDYASMPLAIRTEIGTKRINYLMQGARGSVQTHIRDCGVVVLWPRRPDYPKK